MSKRTTPNAQDWRVPGRLHRAIVCLPSELCQRDRPMQERKVFFEANSYGGEARQLEALLAIAWNVDTTEWCERGFIYNLVSAHEVLRMGYSFGPEETGNLRLLESGCGGDGDYAVGPDRIHYWRAADVDLFVTPAIAAHMHELLARVEALYAAEPARRRLIARRATSAQHSGAAA